MLELRECRPEVVAERLAMLVALLTPRVLVPPEKEMPRLSLPGVVVPLIVLSTVSMSVLALSVSSSCSAALTSSSSNLCCSSQLIHQSLNTQPRTVPIVAHDTTETGETRSWKIPTKQQMKMITLAMC